MHSESVILTSCKLSKSDAKNSCASCCCHPLNNEHLLPITLYRNKRKIILYPNVIKKTIQCHMHSLFNYFKFITDNVQKHCTGVSTMQNVLDYLLAQSYYFKIKIKSNTQKLSEIVS